MHFFHNFFFLPQKDLSNRMLYWCQRAACSITSTMRHVVGHLSDGTKLALQHARNVICKCAASQCCCHAESHCSLALNLSAVRSTLKVRIFIVFVPSPALNTFSLGLWHKFIRERTGHIVGKELYHSIYFPFAHRHFHVDLSARNAPKIYFDNIFHLFSWHFSIYFRSFFCFFSHRHQERWNFPLIFRLLFHASNQVRLLRLLIWLKNRFQGRRKWHEKKPFSGKICNLSRRCKIYWQFAIRFDKIFIVLQL